MLMKRFILCLSLSLATPAIAAEDEDGKSMMQRGAELFFKGLTEQMEPAIEDLKTLTEDMGPELLEFFSSMGPALGELLEEVEDWSVYERPEMLPNGDIIIRRKPDTEEDADDKGVVDL